MDYSGQGILLVEDSQSLAQAEALRIRASSNFPITVAHSLARTKSLLAEFGHTYFAAVADLNLPDAPYGEAVDAILEHKIPTIVLTSTMNESTRRLFEKKPIVDYVVKGGIYKFDYVVKLLGFIHSTERLKVLVVDDLRSNRMVTKMMLEPLRWEILEAEDGLQALECLERHPDIKIILTDQEMPQLNGTDLVEKIRKDFPFDEVAIIGISGTSDLFLNTEFLKAGANGFLQKPYVKEELIATVVQNIERIQNIQALRKAAEEDFLTGLYNRKVFFERGSSWIKQAVHKKQPIALAMFDIDFFKKVNDQWGHDVGDAALVHMAKLLKDTFSSEHTLVARLGGEEFAVIGKNRKRNEVQAEFETFREIIEGTPLPVGDRKLQFTISTGLHWIETHGECVPSTMKFLENRLKVVDDLLYQAKASGRNCVCTQFDGMP